MDAITLRTLQAPLKDRYRQDPESAVTPLAARADFRDTGVTCTVDGWNGPIRAGLHAATGGDGSDACSGDLLLQALLACAGVTLRSVATALGIEVRGAEITASSSFDARGTLGVDRQAAVGCAPIRVDAVLDTDADDEALTRLAGLTERYCVVGQSLREPPAVSVTRKG
jgi:uncharacterized OsmC-like protein